MITCLGQISHHQTTKWMRVADIGGIPEAVDDGVNGILIPPREAAPPVQDVTLLLRIRYSAGKWDREGKRSSVQSQSEAIQR